MSMPGWSDIYGLGQADPEDPVGFQESSARVQTIIDGEVAAGIPSERIAVCGFSQGGALALHFSLRSDMKLAGCIACSSWLPLRDDYPEACGKTAKDLTILQCHGDEDLVVNSAWGKLSHDFIKDKLGVSDVAFKEYDGLAHGFCQDELNDVSAFLRSKLAS